MTHEYRSGQVRAATLGLSNFARPGPGLSVTAKVAESSPCLGSELSTGVGAVAAPARDAHVAVVAAVELSMTPAIW